MTIDKAKAMSDWLLKLLMPLFVAIVSFALQSVQSELKELRAEIKQLHAVYQARIETLSTEVAVIRTRLEHYK
jgi:uncharacterized protein YceH (UPF0502 family)